MAVPVPPWADVSTTQALLATTPEIARDAMRALEDRLLWSKWPPVHDKNSYLRAIVRNKEEKIQVRRMLDFDAPTEGSRSKQAGGHDEMMNCNGDNENGEGEPPWGEGEIGATSQALGPEENEEVKIEPDHNHRVLTPQVRGPDQPRKWVDLTLTVTKVHNLLSSPRPPSVSMHADLPVDGGVAHMSIEDQLLLYHCLDELSYEWGAISRQEKSGLHQRIIYAGRSIT